MQTQGYGVDMHCLRMFPNIRPGFETWAGRHGSKLPLRTVLFIIVWACICLVESYDTYFAWHYREMLADWELNPFILWLAGIGGLASVFLFKLSSIIFSTTLAALCHHRRHRLEIPYTVVVGAVNFMLSFHYFFNHLHC
jgi:hypothetical protein